MEAGIGRGGIPILPVTDPMVDRHSHLRPLLFPEIPASVLTDIATQTGGNVRAALTDAAAHRDVLRFQQLAA